MEEEAGDKRLEALSTLLTALDTAGMRGDVTRIEFADPEEMAFLYQDRISVRLGTLNELDYKLKLARHVLLNEDGKGCAATDTGTLDFTHISMSSTASSPLHRASRSCRPAMSCRSRRHRRKPRQRKRRTALQRVPPMKQRPRRTPLHSLRTMPRLRPQRQTRPRRTGYGRHRGCKLKSEVHV